VGASAIPTIQYGIALPILIGGLLLWRSDSVARVIDAVPQQWLIGVQLYRALGVIFLILYVAGKLPALFAWPAGVGDIAIGLLAPVVGFAYARAPRDTAGLVRAWNVFGILDLVVAVTTGFLTSPSLIQPIDVQPNSELMTMLPMVLIPVYLVPLSIMLHIASLAKLGRRRRRTETGSPELQRNRGSAIQAALRLPGEDARPLPYSSSDAVSGVATGCGFEIMKAATSQAC
jgi:hypothetical protein